MSGPAQGRWDPALSAAVLGVAICAVVLSVGAALAFGPSSGAGVLCGGLLATFNLLAFVLIGRAFLAQEGRAAP